jgi:hypothetical protein
MNEPRDIRPDHVIGPLGNRLTIGTMPSPDTRHWVVRRKAEVVAAVTGGLLSVEEACERYNLSLEEFTHWQESLWRYGMLGLRVTSVQHYRALAALSRGTA